MKNNLKYIFTLIVLVLSLAGCQEERTISSRPEAVVVDRTVPPFEGAVWIDTEYRWDGRTYVIVPAHWSKPMRSGVWVTGHWNSSKKGYSWIPGYWK